MGSAAKCNTLRFHSGKRCSKIIHQCSKIIRSKSRHLKLRMRKSSSSKDLGKIQNLFRFGTVLALYIDIRKRELKMRKFTSYSPVGSDDGYDYQKITATVRLMITGSLLRSGVRIKPRKMLSPPIMGVDNPKNFGIMLERKKES